MKGLSSFTIFLLFAVVWMSAAAQDNGCHVRISLLTCAPGAELYSTFGHTALLIEDSVAGTEDVYNYGTFDFSDPNFIMKFALGKTDCFLSVDQYPDFMERMKKEERIVWEQTLNLTCAEEELVIKTLVINLQDANRRYKYDFIYDNCTTRIRDLIFRSVPGSVVKNRVVPEGTTPRNLINACLDKGGEPWSELGIDILLGSRLDKPVDNATAMFLPDYLSKGVDNDVISHTKPIAKEKMVLLGAAAPVGHNNKYVPLILFTVVCGLLAILFLSPNQKAITFCRYVDSFLLYMTGLLGVLLMFMWWGTDHRMTKDNYNLLWALPTNIIATYFVWRRPAWIKTYFYIAFAVTALLLIGWFWLPQEFNISLVPFVFLMLYRYGSLAMKKKMV